MRRAIWGAAHFLAKGKAQRCWFVTLTYRDGRDWRAMHMARYLDKLRAWCSVFGCRPRYAWVGELQKRGAIHYHVAVWLPKSLALPKPDKCGWWPHGMSQRALAIAPIGYLMKYVSKGASLSGELGEQGVERFPKGARLYGMGGLDVDGRQVVQWLNQPEWVKNAWGVGDVRRVGSRYVVRSTGEILESPWRVELQPGCLVIQQVGAIAPKLHGGPYSRIAS